MTRFILWLCAAVLAFSTPAMAQSNVPIVFAAASMKNALDDAATAWSRESGMKVTISYGPSSGLAKQIEAGAPAEMFISADLAWMDELAKKNLIKPETRANLLANRIVLVAPKDSPVSLTIGPSFPLARALAGGKLAMANTDAVPAGKYGKAALQKLGVWDAVKGDIAQAADVRAALALVARGEAPLGVVYSTDAAAEPRVRIVGTFPENSHPPIIYPIALTANARNPAIVSFLAFLRSPAARPAFEKQGFTVVRASGQS